MPAAGGWAGVAKPARRSSFRSMNGDQGMPTGAPIDDYCKHAKEKFTSLNISDFRLWKLSSSVHTMIDYHAIVDSSPPVGPDDVGAKVITRCKSLLNDMGPKWP